MSIPIIPFRGVKGHGYDPKPHLARGLGLSREALAGRAMASMINNDYKRMVSLRVIATAGYSPYEPRIAMRGYDPSVSRVVLLLEDLHNEPLAVNERLHDSLDAIDDTGIAARCFPGSRVSLSEVLLYGIPGIEEHRNFLRYADFFAEWDLKAEKAPFEPVGSIRQSAIRKIREMLAKERSHS